MRCVVAGLKNAVELTSSPVSVCVVAELKNAVELTSSPVSVCVVSVDAEPLIVELIQ